MVDLINYLLYCSHWFGFLSWKDFLEILFFSYLIYHFSLWLKKDERTPLLSLFYGYCLMGIIAHLTDFWTIKTFVVIYSPLVLMIMILIHQELLQRNFVALKKIIPNKKNTTENWIELLISACLKASNNNKTIQGIIEQRTIVQNFMKINLEFQAPTTSAVLNFIFESQSFNPHQYILLSPSGVINGLNVTWKKEINTSWLPNEVNYEEKTLVNSLKITQNTNALFFRCNANSGSFDIIAQGKLIENLPAPHALRIIRHTINKLTKKEQKNEVSPLSKEFSMEQLYH